MKRNAYSMIELAIAVVIIGLLTVSIVGGRKLLFSANTNRIVQEYHNFKSAVENFKDLYGYLPGDYPDAYQHWGSDVGCLDASVLSADYDGCNGDGDGKIELIATGGEAYKVVQHLAQSRIIPGNFPIVEARLDDPKSEFYPSRLSNAYYSALYTNSNYPTCWSGFDTSHGSEAKCGRHKMFLGYFDATSNVPDSPALAPLEAKRIDDKIDDDDPWSGFVQIRYAEASSCNGASNAAGVGSYDLTAQAKLCLPMFFID